LRYCPHHFADNKAVAFLGINAIAGQEPFVMPLLHNEQINWVPLKGDIEWCNDVYGVSAFPTTFLIGRDGKVYFKPHIGNSDGERSTELAIDALLAMHRLPSARTVLLRFQMRQKRSSTWDRVLVVGGDRGALWHSDGRPRPSVSFHNRDAAEDHPGHAGPVHRAVPAILCPAHQPRLLVALAVASVLLKVLLGVAVCITS
jgi:hypothetical protein